MKVSTICIHSRCNWRHNNMDPFCYRFSGFFITVLFLLGAVGCRLVVAACRRRSRHHSAPSIARLLTARQCRRCKICDDSCVCQFVIPRCVSTCGFRLACFTCDGTACLLRARDCFFSLCLLLTRVCFFPPYLFLFFTLGV